MINRVYRLKDAGYIETDFEELDIASDDVIVRPTYLSICAADQRYYLGRRSPEVMAKKLPMALIHEGIGEVLQDNSGVFHPGDKVAMIPNVPSQNQQFIKENYRSDSHFLSSGYDGFMQDYVALPQQQLVLLPENAGMQYVMCELLSVACNAVSTWEQLGRCHGNRFGIWGSGSVGYATALVLKMLCPDAHITVIGRHRDKLQYFSFVNECKRNNELGSADIFDCCFECVGGSASQAAVNQMIDFIRPQGVIVLMGVSEEPAALNTRMILEKGLVLLGASRSDRTDFETVVSLIRDNSAMESYLDVIVSQHISVKTLQDINTAFHTDNTVPFKTVMEWRM